MSFLLRAALVIGTLSYLAAMRGPPGSADSEARPVAKAPAAEETAHDPAARMGAVAAAWGALPADARQRLAQEAMAELTRRVGTIPASRDTLAEADRKAAWRGMDGR